jgi:hypothetical protein
LLTVDSPRVYSPNFGERLSEKVLSGVSIEHLGGILRQEQGYFAPFFDS